MPERLGRWLELTHYRAEQIEDIVEAYRSGPMKGEPSREEIRRHDLNVLGACIVVPWIYRWQRWIDLWRRWTGRENKP